MIKTVLILSSATMLASMICTAPVFADDAPLCHDMPTHEKVLQEAKSYLHHEGENMTAEFFVGKDGIQSRLADIRTINQFPLAPTIDDITSDNIENDIRSGLCEFALIRLERFGTDRFASRFGEALRVQTELSVMQVSIPEKRWRFFQYITNSWRNLDNFESHHFYILSEMMALGWDEQVNDLFNDFPAQSDNNRIDKMIILADWSAKSGRRDLFEQECQRIVSTLQKLPNTFDQNLEQLASLKSLLIKYPSDSEASRLVSEKLGHLENQNTQIKANTALLEIANREELRKRQCLDMAEELNRTAFNLERNDHFDMAAKLYKQALEIKKANLDQDDPELINQTLDFARIAGERKNYTESSRLYQGAITDLKRSPRADKRDLMTALQNYAQMLAKSNQPKLADKIYDEARRLSTE